MVNLIVILFFLVSPLLLFFCWTHFKSAKAQKLPGPLTWNLTMLQTLVMSSADRTLVTVPPTGIRQGSVEVFSSETLRLYCRNSGQQIFFKFLLEDCLSMNSKFMQKKTGANIQDGRQIPNILFEPFLITLHWRGLERWLKHQILGFCV